MHEPRFYQEIGEVNLGNLISQDLVLDMNRLHKHITDVVTNYGHGETIGRILG